MFVAAGFFLAAAMKRTPGWQAWARPARWLMILVLALYIADGLLGNTTGLGGLLERLLAATGAAAIAVLAVGVLRRSPAMTKYQASLAGRPPGSPAERGAPQPNQHQRTQSPARRTDTPE